MGSITQKIMRKFGVNEELIKKIFQSTQDRMLQAIISGDLIKVDLLYTQYKYDFGEMSEDFENCLHVAVRCNQKDIVKYIIQSYQGNENKQFHLIEDKNMQGDSPLMIAVMTKNFEMTKYLVQEALARVRSRENIGGTIFMAACSTGNMDILKYIHECPVNYYSKNNDGQNALHRACFFGEIQIVRYLLKNTKLQILSKDKHGNNCFHLAAKRLNLTLLRYLLKKFKRQQNIIHIPNGEDQSFIQILCNIFNQIRDVGYDEVTEKQILGYINNKSLPPEIFPWVRKQIQRKKTIEPSRKKTILVKHNLEEEIQSFAANMVFRKRGSSIGTTAANHKQKTKFIQQKGKE